MGETGKRARSRIKKVSKKREKVFDSKSFPVQLQILLSIATNKHKNFIIHNAHFLLKSFSVLTDNHLQTNQPSHFTQQHEKY
jgi:hypothetical protein